MKEAPKESCKIVSFVKQAKHTCILLWAFTDLDDVMLMSGECGQASVYIVHTAKSSVNVDDPKCRAKYIQWSARSWLFNN